MPRFSSGIESARAQAIACMMPDEVVLLLHAGFQVLVHRSTIRRSDSLTNVTFGRYTLSKPFARSCRAICVQKSPSVG